MYFIFIVTTVFLHTKLRMGSNMYLTFSLELSSTPPLATILIPPHARIQAAASTPTNATAASGENAYLFYKKFCIF